MRKQPGFGLPTAFERRELLRLAREAIVARLGGSEPPIVRPTGALARPAGAFVTLRLRGLLRGCIGRAEARDLLAQVVVECAAAAATDDPRFAPLDGQELQAVEIEVSVLSLIERVSDPAAIEVGRHGIVVQQGASRGLLLPQVATDHRWDRETFLAQTCLKAGLAWDGWKQGVEIFRFEADVFGESEWGPEPPRVGRGTGVGSLFARCTLGPLRHRNPRPLFSDRSKATRKGERHD